MERDNGERIKLYKKIVENLKKYDICKLEIIANNMKYCDKNIMNMLQDIINDEKEEI